MPSRIFSGRVFSLASIFLLLTASLAWSQDTRGTITGRVTDPSGAVIGNASVTVTNSAMGYKSTLTTSVDGIYRVTYLSPGNYDIEVTAPGFKKALRSGLEVRVADRLEINLALEIGASEQSVSVTQY